MFTYPPLVLKQHLVDSVSAEVFAHAGAGTKHRARVAVEVLAKPAIEGHSETALRSPPRGGRTPGAPNHRSAPVAGAANARGRNSPSLDRPRAVPPRRSRQIAAPDQRGLAAPRPEAPRECSCLLP